MISCKEIFNNFLHLLWLRLILIKGIRAKLWGSNFCYNAKAGLTLICDVAWLYLSSPLPKSSIKLLCYFTKLLIFWVVLSVFKRKLDFTLFWNKDFKPILLPVFKLFSDAEVLEMGNFHESVSFLDYETQVV